MKKIAYGLVFFITLFIFNLNIYALEEIELVSPNYVIYDKTTDQIITSKNLDEKINIASLTKIMTTITAIEKIDDLNKTVTITQEMFTNIPYDASVAGLKVGDVVTLKDLLYASMLPSGADATQALAYSLSGGINSFVTDMNDLAHTIGLTNTHFVNTTGLDIDNHYSTLNDLIKLLKYALDNELFSLIYQTREYTLSNGLKVNSTITLYNRLMGLDTSRILGSKTGFTSKAGNCISFLFKSNHDYIAITTGAPRAQGTFYNLIDALNIIKYIDNNYRDQLISSMGTKYANIEVKYSKIDTLDIISEQDLYLYLPNDYDSSLLTVQYDGDKSIDYKTKVGEKLGTLKYYYNNELVLEEDITLNKEIKMSIIKVLLEPSSIAIIIIIIIIFIFRIKRKKRKKKHKKR